MKFNFNKKMVSTIVILIFGVAITVAALSAKNIALENKTSSEIATEAVSATEMLLDTENTETGNVDKNSSDSSKDKATVVDDKDKFGDTKNSDESSTTTKETGKSLKDTKSSSENTDNNDSRDSYETDIMKNDESEDTSDDVNKTGDKIHKKSEINNSVDSGSGTDDSDNDNSGMNNNNEPKSDNGVIELPIIPID